MYHLELRQFPHNLNRFNLSEQQLHAVVVPWAAEKVVEIGERKWSPHQATLTILEGPELGVHQLSMGRGWRAAQRHSTDVTEWVLDAAKQALERATPVQAQPVGAAGGQQTQGAADVGGGEIPGDALTLGVQLASLLGPDPSALLAAWRSVAGGSPGLTPSQSLALAEQQISAVGRSAP
jgi:hypothetical protein